MTTSVLLVDDNEGDLAILSKAFSEAGHRVSVTACSEVDQAYEWIDNHNMAESGATIIVTDLNMPGVDGFEFIEALRDRQEPPPVIIVLSTSSRRNDIHRAYRLGANAYHTKPMGFAETTQLCQQIIDYWTATAYLPEYAPSVSSLIYVSEATDEFERSDLEDLELRASLANRIHDVSGFLTSVDGHFFQYLEGPQDGLDAIYWRITQDPRHKIIRHVPLGSGRRRFARWGMNVVGAGGAEERRLEDLVKDSMQSVVANQERIRSAGPVMELMSRMTSVHHWFERNL